MRHLLATHGVLALVLVQVVSGAACEHVVTLRGQVVVPVEIQRQFSREAPGLLLFGGGAGRLSLGADVVATLCDPSDQPLQIPFRKENFDCAEEGEIWFRLSRLSPAEQSAASCGIHQQSFDALVNAGGLSTASIDQVVATASATVFKGRGGACSSGDETVNVTLAPVP